MFTKIRSKIGRLIAGQKSLDVEARQQVVYIGGYPVYMTVTDFLDTEIDRIDVNVGIAVRLCSNSISNLPIVVKKRIVEDGEESWIPDSEHELNQLFKRPNPFNTGQELKAHITQSLIVCANSYCVIARDGSILPNQLWLHQPWMFKLQYNKSDGLPLNYLWDPYRRKKVYELDDVLHIRSYHMSKPFEGVPPLRPVIDQAKSNKFALDYNKHFFKNGAMPDMLFEDETMGGMGPEQQKEFVESFDDKHQGQKNAFKRGILPPGIKAKPISPSIKDMMFAELIRLNREQILGFLGIPPSEAGIYEYANYANALVQKKTFWENTLIPLIRLIETGINTDLIWKFFDDNYKIEFDLADVSALQTDMLKEAQRIRVLAGRPVITLNEGRQMLDFEPVEGGDEIPQQIPGPGGPQAGTALNGKMKAASSREFKKLQYNARLTDEETIYAKLIKTYFRGQQKRILRNIRKSTSDGLLMFTLKYQIDDMNRKDNPDDPNQIFRLSEENEVLRDSAMPHIEEVVQRSGTDALRSANVDLPFDVENPAVNEMIDRIWNRSKIINDDTFKEIKQLLNEAYANQWSLGQLESALNGKYFGWINGSPGKQSRAMTIARTEMNAVVSGASDEAYKQHDIDKEWLASLDSNTRIEHANADGQRVAAGQAFNVGGESLKYPGDPNGSAANVINCRCAVIPAIDE